VWVLAYARLRNADTAKEITQEAFLRLWQRWEAGEKILRPRAWLLRVVRNWAEDQRKSAFHRHGTQAAETLNGVRSGELSPPELLARYEQVQALMQALATLMDVERDLFLIKYREGYTYEQIAEQFPASFGPTPRAVKRGLSRIRQRLRRLVQEP
jgi:RNA polymerase sigma-70 factor (ECF subfamily)